MKSKILALKYRPQEFEDLIGQEIMVKAITNGIYLKKTCQMVRYVLMKIVIVKI